MTQSIRFSNPDAFTIRRHAIRAVSDRAGSIGYFVNDRIAPTSPRRCARFVAAIEAAVLSPDPVAALRPVLQEHCPTEWSHVAPDAEPFVLALVLRSICSG